MAATCLTAVCCCIWEPLKEALLGFLGTALTDTLSFLQNWGMEEFRSRTALWGNRIQRLPTISASTVSRAELLLDIHGYLKNDQVGIIGIYGMAGVGKTTLLRRINNRLLQARDHRFDVVVWVTVSRDVDIQRIQEDIGVRLGFSRPEEGHGRQLPTNTPDRRLTLHKALFKRKFLLLLDDLWEKLDLEEVGIPHPMSAHNGSKIAFTTRRIEVCADMDAQGKVKVTTLNQLESWELFCSKLGNEVDLNNDGHLRPFAEKVVQQCGGLPLALITIGRAMSGAKSMDEWKGAILRLQESPDVVRGMQDVLRTLKFSFDKLEDETAKQCLLYCSLFSEDHLIDVDLLIRLWSGEGFLDEESKDYTHLDRARMRGHSIIKMLKNACLLEDGSDDTSVKLHDVVREMALWLTGKTYKPIMYGRDRHGGFKMIGGWEDAQRISINMQSKMAKLQCPESGCSNLITFLVYGSGTLHSVPQNFFEYMSALGVLDLSRTYLEELPTAIGLLVELRHLNLQDTLIKRIPKEVGQLKKLRQLDLRSTPSLAEIPQQALVTLTSLQSLDLWRSGYCTRSEDDGDGICLRDLDHLGRLEELGVDIPSRQCLDSLLCSKKLRRCTRWLRIRDAPDLTSGYLSMALQRMPSLERLHVHHCPALEGELQVEGSRELCLVELRLWNLTGLRGFMGDFHCLRSLQISLCPQLNDLSWVSQLSHLEELHLTNCHGVEELQQQHQIEGDGSGGHGDSDHHNRSSFPMLKVMDLEDLPAFRSISRLPLLFPHLEKLYVSNCPQLKRLPFNADSGKKIKTIIGEQEWWDGLEWDNQNSNGSNIKLAFTPFFEPF